MLSLKVRSIYTIWVFIYLSILAGSFETMRHFKKDVTELRKGTECGLNLAGFDALEVDDVIQTYEILEIPGVL